MKASLFKLVLAFAATTTILADDAILPEGASAPAPVPAPRFGFSQVALDKCKSAPNCEVYETPNGASIRFVPGMEPGSAHYTATFPHLLNVTEGALDKRRIPQTNIELGRNSMNYGTTNPTDMFNHCAYSYCYDYGCQNVACNAQTKDIESFWLPGVSGTRPRNRNMVIRTQGQYFGADQRNNFVEALKVAASQGSQWTTHGWHWSMLSAGHTPVVATGEQRWARHSDWFDIVKFDGPNLQGWINSQASMDSLDSSGKWCATTFGALRAIAGAVNKIAGGFFGVVGAFCPV